MQRWRRQEKEVGSEDGLEMTFWQKLFPIEGNRMNGEGER